MTYYDPRYQPQQTPKKSRTGLWVTLAILAVMIFGFAACVATVGSEADKAVSGESSIFDEVADSRTLKVGSEIQPGEYKVTPNSEFGGYVARLSCTTGEFDCIISNDLVDGPVYLTVLPDDYAVQLDRVDYEPAG